MSVFVSDLAVDLDAFLVFKRSLGYAYRRAEFTLRDFDRFVFERTPGHGSLRLDETILAWLSGKHGRKSVSVTCELSLLRQFCLHRRRSHPNTPIPGRLSAPQPTQSKFLPYVFTDAQVRDLVHRATQLGRPRFRGAVFRALLLLIYCTGIRFGEALRLRMRDVDMEQRLLFVAESKGRSRWVPFDRSLARELVRYLRARAAYAPAAPADRFFVGVDRQRLPTNTAWHTISKLFREAGLKPRSGRIGLRISG
jgi:integrase/recombinase XerD